MQVSLHEHKRVVKKLTTVLLILLALLIAGLVLFLDDVIEYRKLRLYLNDELPSTHNLPTVPERGFLEEEEGVFLTSTSTHEQQLVPIEKVLFEYVEVVDGCGPHFEGDCLNVRSGPGLEYPVVAQLRNGIVLKVGGEVKREGERWFKIVFDEWLRYPERVTGDWYVDARYVEVLLNEGDKTVWEDGVASSTAKEIIVERNEQLLYAYEDGKLFLETPISTGLALTPTPRGEFSIFKKTPSRYMQGPLPNLPSDQYYDMPGVPWNLYFTDGGAVIHGAYWHTSFGKQYSHGCVNLPPETARQLYEWAELGTKVTVRD
jgi:hypothetical protein